MAKNVTNAEEPEELAVPEEAVLEVVPELVEPAIAAPAAAKRALGAKEPIVFKWKVVGASQGAIVTLYKSVEREEAEAQAERLRKEDYYRDVRILEASAKVEQPVQKVAKKSRPEPPAKVLPGRHAEGAKKPARAPTVVRKAVARKATAKTATKSARKKPASTSTSKRVAKSR